MTHHSTDRRTWLQRGVLFVAGSAVVPRIRLTAEEQTPCARLGLITDVHHADKPSTGTRYYRESLRKLAEATARFRQEKVDCIVELGDIIDSAETLDAEKGSLRRVWQALAISCPCYPVLGNHCASALTKREFLEIVERDASYYAFDLGGYHFVVLDACFRKDGEPYGRNNFQWTDANIPPAELDWLTADLQQTSHPCIVFVHQRLDAQPPYGIANASDVRRVLEASGKVLVVFQGHYHPGDYSQLNGVHYCTLAAMIEGSGPKSSAYALLEVLPTGAMRLTGYHRQKGYDWPQRRSAPARTH